MGLTMEKRDFEEEIEKTGKKARGWVSWLKKRGRESKNRERNRKERERMGIDYWNDTTKSHPHIYQRYILKSFNIFV